MQVLLVSTDPDLTDLVRSALLGAGDADVTLVATPQRALAVLEEAGPFALVVADSDTHPAGGLFLAREVKARARMAAPAGAEPPPVLLLLARHQDAWLADWAEADAYVLKPADPFDLAEVAGALIEGRAVPALPGVRGRRVESGQVGASAAGALEPATAADVPAGRPEEVP